MFKVLFDINAVPVFTVLRLSKCVFLPFLFQNLLDICGVQSVLELQLYECLVLPLSAAKGFLISLNLNFSPKI